MVQHIDKNALEFERDRFGHANVLPDAEIEIPVRQASQETRVPRIQPEDRIAVICNRRGRILERVHRQPARGHVVVSMPMRGKRPDRNCGFKAQIVVAVVTLAKRLRGEIRRPDLIWLSAAGGEYRREGPATEHASHRARLALVVGGGL